MNNKNKYIFQDDAIKNIVSDFGENSSARLLLVIPTGGGKTLTAIRSINEMIDKGEIHDKAKCLWITHRKALKKQTTDVRDNQKWAKKFKFSTQLSNLMTIKMVKEGERLINHDKNNEFKYVIIDECHHSSAASYDIFFRRKNLGILGLTATPTRLDKKELVFDKTSYQITFRKLVSAGVIIKPKFQTILTNETITSSDISLNNKKQSEKFDTQERNLKIVDEIINNQETYSKVVIYVNTVSHAKSLYRVFLDFTEEDPFYNFVGFIAASNNNHLKIDNNKYLDKFKKSKTGIIINTNILTEGYDDPSINTIAMGVPTSSLVRYIQCVGRAIRNPDDLGSNFQAPSVLDFSDNLPDISYRITSGWLFADISDDLQPVVKTVYVRDDKDLLRKVKLLIEKFNLKNIDLDLLKVDRISDYESLNLFIFNAFENHKNKYFKWHGLLINESTKEDFIFAYNNINNSIFNKITSTHIFNYMLPELKDIKSLNHTPKQLMNLYHSMYSAFEEVQNKSEVTRLKYFIFEKIPYPEQVELFLENCFNKDGILSAYESMNLDNKINYILKFPSKFINQYEAFYASEEQYLFCEKFISQVNQKIEIEEPYALNSTIQQILDSYESFNIPLRFIDGLYLINKEKIEYKYKL